MVTVLGYALLLTLKHFLKLQVRTTPKSPTSGMDNAGPPVKAPAPLSTLQEGRRGPVRHGWARDPPPPDHATFAETKPLFQQLRHRPAGMAHRLSPRVVQARQPPEPIQRALRSYLLCRNARSRIRHFSEYRAVYCATFR
jgi:hypothetical protein